MALPDIPRGRYTWQRQRSQGWVERALQLVLIEFVTVFEDEHQWVRRGSMTVEECFSDTGVNVRVPTGPTAPYQRPDNFMQRTGLPIVKLYCTRERDSRTFEVAVPFALGNDTPTSQAVLSAARASLRAQELRSR